MNEDRDMKIKYELLEDLKQEMAAHEMGKFKFTECDEPQNVDKIVDDVEERAAETPSKIEEIMKAEDSDRKEAMEEPDDSRDLPFIRQMRKNRKEREAREAAEAA